MIITYFSIQNCRSIGKKIELKFDKGLNILIGPNGSGKSHVLDILNLILDNYFIRGCNANTDSGGNVHLVMGQRNLPANRLYKNWSSQALNTIITIAFKFLKDDLDNILLIRKKLGLIIEQENNLSERNKTARSRSINIERNFWKHLDEFYKGEDANLNSKAEFTIENWQLHESENSSRKIWLGYMNYFEQIKYLMEDHNITDLRRNWYYLPPNRFNGTIRNNVSQLPDKEINALNHIRKQTSGNIGSSIEYAIHHFASIKSMLSLKNEKSIECNKKDNTQRFIEHPQVIDAKKLLSIIGNYDFKIERFNRTNNQFFFIVQANERDISPTEFGLALSSGEQELISLILTISALNLKNACILIDEPELHLHPCWQKKLLKLMQHLSETRGIQFIMATHSPVFVNQHTISNITRVYKPEQQTKVIKAPAKEAFKQKDLLDIITYTNSAGLFFADKVVLVEGITDQIVFQHLIETGQETRQGKTISVAVVPVYGKLNFIKYIEFLLKFKIKPYIVCDLDNIWDGTLLENAEGLSELKGAITNKEKEIRKQWKCLAKYLDKDKTKEVTRKHIAEKILEIVQNTLKDKTSDADKDFLKSWIDKCMDKKKILDTIQKEDTSGEMNIKGILEAFKQVKSIKKYNIESVYVLSKGCLENYSDTDSNDKKQVALDLIKELSEYQKKSEKDNGNFNELIEIASCILGTESKQTGSKPVS